VFPVVYLKGGVVGLVRVFVFGMWFSLFLAPSYLDGWGVLLGSCSGTAFRGTYITPADSGVFDVDQDIVGVLEGGNGAVFEFDLVNTLEDEGEVLSLLLARGVRCTMVIVVVAGWRRGGSHLAIYLSGLG
jgi:hypothetical protein